MNHFDQTNHQIDYKEFELKDADEYSNEEIKVPLNKDVQKDHKVLVIENDKRLNRILKNIISPHFQFHGVRKGNEGLRQINEIVPDIVICNIDIPDMDGYRVTKAIKSNLKTCHIPVMLLTDNPSKASMVKAYNCGTDDFMILPVDIQVFLFKLKRLILNRELIHKKYREQYYMIDYSQDISSEENLFIKKVNEIIENHIEKSDLSVAWLAKSLNLSKTQVYRKIKTITGYSTVEYIRLIRLNKAAHMLKNNQYLVKEVCFMVGFNSFSYFVRCFKDYFGETPMKYKKRISNNNKNKTAPTFYQI
jgi:YesN/AraC family two-component response regulator